MTLNRRALMWAAAVATALAPTGPLSAQEASRWARRKRFVSVNGRRMSYYETGRGDPIVFLHGNPTSSFLWRNVIPHVEQLGRCIAPDMIGMGDSEPLPDSGPGKYTFEVHRDYLFGLFDALDLGRRVTLVVHDWGSGVGFSWAQRYTDRVRGLAYMEPILRPPTMPMPPAPTSGPFATFRSAAGEQAVLQDNMFVEQLLIGGLDLYLSEEEKAEYRRPYLTAGESRRPTLEWPRELPMGGEPAGTAELVTSYTQWLHADTRVPKLFVRAVPGAILANPAMLEYVREFKNQQEVTVYGTHYVQEISPHAIGRALARWISGALG